MSEEQKRITQMFGIYLVFGSWVGFFVLGFFVNEVFTNYSLCKKDKNKHTCQTIDCRDQIEKTKLTKVKYVGQ